MQWRKIRFLNKTEENWGRLCLLFCHGIIFKREPDGTFIITKEHIETLNKYGIKIKSNDVIKRNV